MFVKCVMSKSDLQHIETELQRILRNFAKSGKRIPTVQHLDKTSARICEFKTCYLELCSELSSNGQKEQLEQCLKIDVLFDQIVADIDQRRVVAVKADDGAVGVSSSADDDDNGLSDDGAYKVSVIKAVVANEGKDTQIRDISGGVTLRAAKMSGISFLDVEASLEKFDGVSLNTERWLKNFENIAETCEWSNVQKYIFCRRLLTGAARLAVEADDTTLDFKSLKQFLTNEFKFVVKGEDVYEELRSIKKNPSETNIEFAYRARRVASRGTVDDPSLVSYIVRGLGNAWFVTPSLFESRTFADLKDKLEMYDHTRPPAYSAPAQSNNYTSRSSGESWPRTCFKCGRSGHTARECSSAGYVCHKCGAVGHVARECPETVCYKCGKKGHISPHCNASSGVAALPNDRPI